MNQDEKNITVHVDGPVYGGYFGIGKLEDHKKKSEPNEIRKRCSSILRIRQPISNLVETEKYREIYSKVSRKNFTILQCCGIPGSGKSQIVRRLGKLFPFTKENNDENNQQTVKWHIQCKDSGHILKLELQKLLENLHKIAQIIDQAECQFSTEALDEGSSESIVEILVNCKLNTLIIIEDPVGINCTRLLKDFLRNLQTKTEKVNRDHRRFHLYLTSRTNSLIETDENYQISCFENVTVYGFTEKESVEYLLKEFKYQEDEKGAKKIHRRFGGLPLGLQPAKRFCQDSRISYTDYLCLLNEPTFKENIQNKNNVVGEYGKSAPNVFQAIVTPFTPIDSKDIDKVLQYKILSCLSYFNYDRIPEYAIKHCFNLLQVTTCKTSRIMNKVYVGQLITKLFEHHMCSITDKEEITFHEVVLNSFRLIKSTALEHFNPIKMAVELMAGLVSKDARKKEQQQRMLRMRRHLETLLEHVENCDDIFKKGANKLLLEALVSHLYETTAVIMLIESPLLFWNKTDSYYKRALDLIWKDDNKPVPEYLTQSSSKVAKSLVTFSKSEGDLLPENFTVDYVSKLNISLDEDEVRYLKCQSNSKLWFEKFEENWNENLQSKNLIENLQNCGLFLSNEKYRSIFYAERIASILHSWSRRILYADSNEAQKDERSKWMTELSHSICLECKNSCNVSLLIERLSITGGLVPITLKHKNKNCDYIKVLKLCTLYLSTKKDMLEVYENGLRRETFGPSYDSTCIVLLRSIVRVNARLINSACEEFDKEVADKQCKDLFNMAMTLNSKISTCSMCIIYCAKYYAACENVQKCMECFDKFFEMERSDFGKVYKVHSWGVSNYLRAVSRFKVSYRHKEAISKGKKVLKSVEKLSPDLRTKIELLINPTYKKN